MSGNPSWFEQFGGLARRTGLNGSMHGGSTHGSRSMDGSRHSTASGEFETDGPATMIRDLRKANITLKNKASNSEAQFMTQLTEISQKLKEKDRIIAGLERKGKIDAKGGEVSDMKEQLFELQENLEELEFEKHEYLDKITKLEERSKTKGSAEQTYLRNYMILEKNIESLEETVKNQDYDIVSLKKGLELKTKSLHHSEGKENNLNARLQIIEGECMSLKTKNEELIVQVEDMEGELTSESANRGQFFTRIRSLESDNSNLKALIEEECEKNAKLAGEFDDSTEKIKTLEMKSLALVASLREKNESLSDEVSSLQNQVTSITARIDSETKKSESLSAEAKTAAFRIEGLDTERKELKSELDETKQNLEYMELTKHRGEEISMKFGEIDKQNFDLRLKLSSAQENYIKLQKELCDSRKKLAESESECFSKIENMERENIVLLSKLEVRENENSRLDLKLAQSQVQVNQLQDDIANVKSSFNDQKEEWQRNNDILDKSNKEVQSISISLEGENSATQVKNVELQKKVASLEGQKNLLSDKVKSIESISKITKEENSSLRESNQELQAAVGFGKKENEDLLLNKSNLEERLIDVTQTSEKGRLELLAKIGSLGRNITALKSNVEDSKEENKRLFFEIQKIKSLLDSIERYQTQKDMKCITTNILHKISFLLEERTNLQQEVDGLKVNITETVATTKRNTGESLVRVKEITQAKTDLEAELTNLQEENKNVNEEVKHLEEKLNSSYTDSSKKMGDIEREISDLEHKLESTEKKCAEHKDEVEQLTVKLENADMSAKDLESLEAKNKYLQSKLTESDDEVSYLEDELDELKQKLKMDAASAKIEECERRSELQSMVHSTQEENVNLHVQVVSMEKKLNDHKNKESFDKKNSNRIKELEESNSMFQDEIEELKGKSKEVKAEQPETKTKKSPKGSNSVFHNWKELEKTKSLLSETQERFHETQSTLAALEKDNKRMAKENVLTQASLRQDLTTTNMEKSKVVGDLTERIKTLENGKNIADYETKLKNERTIILSLEENVLMLQSKITSLQSGLEDTQQNSKEHLSICKGEIESLQKRNSSQLEEISMQKGSISEKAKFLEDCISRNEALSAEIKSLQEKYDASEAGYYRTANLKAQLEGSRSTVQDMKDEINITCQKKDIIIADLRNQITDDQLDLNRCISSLNELKSTVHCNENMIELMNTETHDLKQLCQEADAKVEEKENDVVSKEAALSEQKQLLETTRAEMEDHIHSLHQEVDTHLSQVQEKNAVIVDMKDETLEQNKTIVQLQLAIEERKDKEQLIRDQLSQLQTSAQKELKEGRDEISRISQFFEDKFSHLKVTNEEFEAKLQNCRASRDSIESEANALRERVNAMESDISKNSDLKRQVADASFALECLGIEKKLLVNSNGVTPDLRAELEKAKVKWSENEDKLREQVTISENLGQELSGLKIVHETFRIEKHHLMKQNKTSIIETKKKLEEIEQNLMEKESIISELKDRIAESRFALESVVVEKKLSSIELEVARRESRDEQTRFIANIASLKKEKDQMKSNLMELKERITDLKKVLENQKHQTIKANKESNAHRQELEGHSLRISEQKLIINNLREDRIRNELEMRECVQSSQIVMQKENAHDEHFNDHLVGTSKKNIDSLNAAKDEIELKLRDTITLLESSSDLVKHLKEKLRDRDTTISALVKSSVTTEKRMALLHTEVEAQRGKSKPKGLLAVSHRRAPTDFIVTEKTAEISALKNALSEVRKRESDLSEEVQQFRERTSLISELESLINDYKRKIHELVGRESDLIYRINIHKETEQASQSKILGLEIQLDSFKKEKGEIMKECQSKLDDKKAEIKKLTGTSLGQEQAILSLGSEIELLQNNIGNIECIQRMQEENELFAASIIEQQDEIDNLRSELTESEDKNESLSKELRSLKMKMTPVEKNAQLFSEAKAHIDEYQSINATQRLELRSLRKRLRKAETEADLIIELKQQLEKANANVKHLKDRLECRNDEIVEQDLKNKLDDAISSRNTLETKVGRLKGQLEDAVACKDAINIKLDESEGKFKDLSKRRETTEDELRIKIALLESREQPRVDDLKLLLRGKEKEINTTKQQIILQEEKNSSLQVEREEIADRLAKESIKYQEVSREIVTLRVKNDEVKMELLVLNEKLTNLKSETHQVSTLQNQINESDQDRSAFEKNALSHFERRISAIKKEKDSEIDKLRTELTEARGNKSDAEADLISQINNLQASNNNLCKDIDTKMQRKNMQIVDLQHQLKAYDQLTAQMRSEMDQLQSSMENAVMIRRAEIEEMQQEVMEGSAKATQQDREIAELKMKLEERKLRHKAEISRLMGRLTVLQQDSPMLRDIQTQRDDRRTEELNDTIQKLKHRNAALADDCQKLREKVESHGSGSGRITSKNDKFRNSALKEQMKMTSKRNKELEALLSLAKQNGSTKLKTPKQYSSRNQDIGDDHSTATKFTF